MKVACLYCDSFVEVNENMTCPMCGAPLGEALEKYHSDLEKEEKRRNEEKAEREKKQRESDREEMIIDAVTKAALGVAGSALAGGLSSSPQRRYRRKNTVSKIIDLIR